MCSVLARSTTPVRTTPTLRASYTLGWWQNNSSGRPESYLTGQSGQPVYSGPINIAGKSYTLAPTAFGLSNDSQTHTMHGVSLKSNTRDAFDWELSASLYDYGKDQQRVPTIAMPAAATGGAGTLQDQGGTGWNTLAPARSAGCAYRGLWHGPRCLQAQYQQVQRAG